MLRGRYGKTSRRPYLQGHLSIPRLQVWGNVSFIVDTGAASTTLAPGDGIRMDIDYAQLMLGDKPARGIGGSVRMFHESEVVVFQDTRGGLVSYDIVLGILDPTDESLALPSLLGRDLLERWRMVFHPAKGILHFET